jgi:hypothetical protein
LLRQKSEKYSYSQSGNDHTYSPQSGTNRQDYAYEYDLVGNILKLKDRTPNSGIDNTTLGTDALDREFDYDPLYRLLKATGRESQTQDSTTLWDNAPKTSTPTPQNVRSYTRKYWYDKMGHMEKLENDASNNNFTRNFNLIAGTK